jgi:hypothetical protein
MSNPIGTWEKLHGATLSLVRSGSIKDRLAQAYRDHLSDVVEEELPKEIREEFRFVSDALTREPPLSRGEDAVRATLRKLSNDEADRIATSVVQMFCVVTRIPTPAPALRAVPVPPKVVPRFLAEA